MEFRLLGPLEVLDDEGRLLPITRGKPRTVLGYLLLHPNQVVSTDHLIDALWTRDLPSRPEAALHVHVSRLRALVGGDGVLVTRPPGYLVRVGPDELDVEVAERLVADAERARRDGRTSVAAELLGEALSLWRGDALADFAFEDFAQSQRRRLDELRLTAVESLLECRLDLGHHIDVVGELDSLVTLHPLRERLWMALMLALYRSGRQAEALRAFSRSREVFASELGVDPSPKMQELEERILLQDESLDLVASSTGDRTRPLPTGMVSFLVTAAAGDGGADLGGHDTGDVEAHGGQVFITSRRRSYAAFQVADDALAAALSIQRRARADGVEVRAALHAGRAEPIGDHFVGAAVADAAAPLAVADGGQILATEAFVAEVAGSDEIVFRDEGDFHLPGESGTRTLMRLIVGGVDDGTSPLRADAIPRTNLTPSLTSIVGRERETAEVGELLVARRMVTITGPGGVGKTRVAGAAAFEQLGLPGGVWWVDLASGTSAHDVATSVAHALGISEASADTLGEIIGRIAESRMLVVLDGCDLLIEEVAELVEPMLQACRGVHVIATSRERLGVPGEWIYPLSALPTPEANASTPEAVTTAESVQLLVERARALTPNFAVTDDNAAAIAAISRAVDGLPLGLELAAARLDALGAADLATRLERSLDVLAGRRRVPVPRHRSLDEAVGWSVRLLDPDHAQALSELTVFSGTFGIEAAEAVCSASGAALDLVVELAEKSLVAPCPGDGDRRFTISRPIRDHVASSMTDDHRFELRKRHCPYYRALAGDVADSIREARGGRVLDRVELEHVEMGAAIDWAMEHDTESAIRMAAALWRYWFQRGYIGEGRRRVEGAIEVADRTSPVMVDLLHGAGVLAYLQGDTAAAVAHRSRGLDIARSLGDDLEIASALVFVGSVGSPHVDEASGTEMLSEGLEILRRAEDARGLASAFSMLGDAGEFHTRLTELSAETLAAFRGRGDDWGVATMLWYLATASREEDPWTAAGRFEEAASLFVGMGDRRGTAQSLEGMGALFDDAGYDEDATILFAVSERLRVEGEAPPTQEEQKGLDHRMRKLRERLGDRFEAVWAEGAALAPEEALDRWRPTSERLSL